MPKRKELGGPLVSRARDVIFLGALCAFLYLFHEIYVDDAFITLAYARTFGEAGIWGMQLPYVSNAATSPLNVLLLSALIRVGLSGLWAAYALECLLVVAIFFTLKFTARCLYFPLIWAYVATLALFTNPLLVSTSGLETYLFIAVLLGCCIAYILERYLLLGLATGLLVLARPDGALLLVPLFILMAVGRRLPQFGQVMIGFALVVGAWSVFSWLHLGSVIPDTYFIKRKEAAWHDFSFENGLALYYYKYGVATFLSLAFAIFVPFGLALVKGNRLWRAFVVLVGGLALVQYAAYSLLNLPPYHWYYGVLIAAVVLIGSAGLVEIAVRFSHRIALGLVAVITLAGAGTCAEAALVRKQMPITTNLGTVGQYRAIADWMNGHVPITEFRMVGELGVIQYYGRADAVNNFSDRRILLDLFHRLRDGSPGKWLAAWNFAHLAVRPHVASDYLLEEDCKDSTGAVKTWTTSSTWIKSIVWCLKREK